MQYYFVGGSAVLLLVAAVLYLRPKRAPLLGLDVGNSQIKMVQVRQRKGKPVVLRYGIVPTPPGSVVNGVVNQPEVLVKALKDAFKGFRIDPRNVITVLTGQGLMVRQLTFPPMPEADLAAAIRLNLHEYLGMPEDRVVYDYRTASRGAAQGTETLHVTLVASAREPVTNFVSEVNRSGATVQAVDIEPLAVWKSVGIPDDGPGDACVIIDLGAGTTNLSIFENGMLQVIRVLPVAGNDLANAVSETLGVDAVRAEELKVHHGVLPGTPISDAINSEFEELLGHIRRTVDFYLVSNPGSRITHVTLVGGNALLPGLKERIDESLSGAFEVERYTAHVEIGNPLASYDLAKGCSPRPQEVPMLAVVLGLTLAGGVRHESGK